MKTSLELIDLIPMCEYFHGPKIVVSWDLFNVVKKSRKKNYGGKLPKIKLKIKHGHLTANMLNHWNRTQWKTMDLLSPEQLKEDYGDLWGNYALFKYKCLNPLMGNNVVSTICEIPTDRLDISSFLFPISMNLASSFHHWDKQPKEKKEKSSVLRMFHSSC